MSVTVTLAAVGVGVSIMASVASVLVLAVRIGTLIGKVDSSMTQNVADHMLMRADILHCQQQVDRHEQWHMDHPIATAKATIRGR